MKSFLEGREAVSRSAPPATHASSQLPALGELPADSTAPALPAHAPASKREHEKKIETVSVDGVIQKIVVTCGCGERIEVHCGY